MPTSKPQNNFQLRTAPINEYRAELLRDVIKGLTSFPKYLPCKYFYDHTGSQLFDQISCLPEYYPTRLEMSILRKSIKSLANNLSKGYIVELGSGTNKKIRVFLDEIYRKCLPDICYVPIDVDKNVLLKSAEDLLDSYPGLSVLGIVGDFGTAMNLIPADDPRLVLFLGTTIGNLTALDSSLLLKNIRGRMKRVDRFVLGFDMMKPRLVLEAAYNDSQGTTALFNKNVLRVLNRELGANFELSGFDHVAFLNEEKEQIEMHLRASIDFTVKLPEANLNIDIYRGETILTEISRKFTHESASRMIDEAGFCVNKWLTDEQNWFSIVELSIS